MECFEIKNLSFIYPNQRTKCLNSISFTVETGEFLTICGKSGCGKTTLLKHFKPSVSPVGEMTGEILFEGKNVTELSLRDESQKLGYVQQNPDNMIVTDKVWHELSFGLENLGVPSEEIRLRVAEMASYFGIQELFHKKTSELSGGQKQLVNLASIMVMNPDVLILDEPTSQLDPIAAQNFLETLKKVNRELGVTVIIAEHRTEEVFAVSDRVALMESGKIIAVKQPCEFGEIIKNNKSELEPMLPTAMQVYVGVENLLRCPITVSQGREWLKEIIKEKVPKVAKNETAQEENADSAIVLDEVFFRYKRETADILRAVSLKIPKGKIYTIVGANGSGKTTLLSVISGILRPYSGKIYVEKGDSMCMLPQNPQTLFLKKSVRLDLEYTLSGAKLSDHEKEREILRVSKLCETESVLERNPYDISGGEMQRVALAKILLLNPKIILMDEPTKGMDAIFKKKFGAMLQKLRNAGITVVLVSHDIEFCAEFGDRCAMFFDGKIISENESNKFFENNRFYTTAAQRMAKNIIPNAVLPKDIIRALDGKVTENAVNDCFEHCGVEWKVAEKEKNIPMKNYNPLKIIVGLIFLGMMVFVHRNFSGVYSDWRNSVMQVVLIVFAAVSLGCFIPKRFLSCIPDEIQPEYRERKFSKRTVLAFVITMVAVPVTVFVGVVYFGDRKYYLISILIIFEILIPFFAMFEGRKPRVSELVTISVLCAIAVAGRIAFAAVPQFKPMLAIVIVAGVCFGWETGFLIGAICGFVSNFYFGQGPWTVWQMIALGFSGLFAGILFRKGFLRKTRFSLCLFGVFSALAVYGVIVNISSIFMMQQQFSWELAMTYIAMGFPFDLVHAAATAVFLWIAAVPMIEKIERIKEKYRIMR